MDHRKRQRICEETSEEAPNDEAKLPVDYLTLSHRPSPSSSFPLDCVNESVREVSDDCTAQLLTQRRNDESKSSRVDIPSKNLLQELALKKGYHLPTYVTSVSDEVHQPTFVSTVKVGEEFFTGQEARSKKQAELSAAKVAYTTLQQRPSSIKTNKSPTLVGELPETNPTPPENQIALNDDSFEEFGHTYKIRLQIYAAKRNLGLPLYSWEHMGPSHTGRFKGIVVLDGKTYESPEFYPTAGKAEHAAAKVAYLSLASDQVGEDESIYKNLLQELVFKYGYPLPIYNTKRSGELHRPVFSSTIEVKGQVFRGLEARSKKQAEMSAAKIAYISLRQCEKSSQSPKMRPSAVQQEATLQSATPDHPNIVNSPDQNIQLQLPEANENVKDRGTDLNSPGARASTSSSSSIRVLGQDLSLSNHLSEVDSNLVKPSSTEGVVTNNSDLAKVVHPQETQMVYPPESTDLPTSNEDLAAVRSSPQLNLNQ